MDSEATTRVGNAGSGYRQDFNRNQIIPKFPPYGKLLSERQRFKNPPKLVFIEVGGSSWTRAKTWNAYPDFAALVLTPEHVPSALIWPVEGCYCLVEWGREAPDTLIIELVKSLLGYGALLVAVMPMWINHNEPSHLFDTSTQTFIKIRECLKIYQPRKEVHHVVA